MARPASLVAAVVVPVLVLGLALVLALWTGRVEAAAPHFRWRTAETPHFRVHYHEGTEEIAERIVRLAEPSLEAIEALIDNKPETPIEVVITDETDGANGFTQVLPRNQITLFPVEPDAFSTLGDYDDFMKLLFVHELTHVVHLDTIGGIAHWFNTIFGKQIAPNQIQPRWFVEGIAVYAESALTGGGRVKSAIVDMSIREQILNDAFPSLDQISTSTRRYPGGNFVYILGGRFLDYIARTYGTEALAEITREYGSRIIPYGLNLVAAHATKKTFVELWDDWKTEEERRTLAVLERVAKEGLVVGRRMVRDTTEIYHPRFSSSGALAFVDAPRYDDSVIVFLDPHGREERRIRTSRGVGSFVAGSPRFVASISDVYLEKFSFTDLEIIDLETGQRRRRTHGARIDEPDVSPDGRTIVAVQRGGGRTWLATLSVDGDEAPEAIYRVASGEDIAAPRWSPDGKRIVCSIHLRGEGRRIAVIDPSARTRRYLTGPGAQDLNPIWASGGASVLFASDRGGVFNIWRARLDGGDLERLTNVETGAFEPALDPSGRLLAFLHGTINGYDLNFLDLAGSSTAACAACADFADFANARRDTEAVVPVSGSLEGVVDRPYSAWETLLPRAWLPTSGLDGVGSTYGIYFAGVDATEAHAYQARIDYGTTSHRLGYGVNYANHSTFTPFSVSSSLVATTRPGSFVAPRPGSDRLESIFRVRLGIDLPFTRWDMDSGFFLSYGFELRRGTNLVSRDPMQIAPDQVTDIDLASAVVGWRFSNVRSFADSISPAKGQAFDVSIEINDPALGSDLRVLSVTAHHSAYFTMPWLKHHILATRIAFGGAAGDSRGRAVYEIGGLPVRDVLRDYIDQIGSGADVIRGYPLAAFRGNAFYLGALEYRVPIVDFERGIETIPVFFDRLNAAAFVDAGDAPGERLDIHQVKVGTGAELRADVAIGYYFPVTARLGLGRGLTSGGTNDLYLVLGGIY